MAEMDLAAAIACVRAAGLRVTPEAPVVINWKAPVVTAGASRGEETSAARVDSEDARPPSIELREGTWYLGEEAFASRVEAFEALEESEWFTEALGRKHPEKLLPDLAEPRWFDAASIEDMPAIQGGQITDAGIDSMVANLAAEKTPIMIDGGGISDVHESTWNTAAKAAGWGFVAVRVTGEDGAAHLWLYGACLPEVDAQIEERKLLFGSIAFVEADTHRYSGEEIGARLVSYALTNRPYVDGLEPHARRSLPNGVLRTRSRRNESMKTTTKRTEGGAPASAPAPETKPTTRGPAQDALAKIAAMFGIDLNDPDATWSLYDKISALKTVATAESAIEGTSGGAAPAPAVAAASQSTADGATARAVEGLEGPELEAAFSQLLTAVRLALGREEATPAEVTDLLKANADAIKGAITATASEDPKPDGEEITGHEFINGETVKGEDTSGLKAQPKGEKPDLRSLLAEHDRAGKTAELARRDAERLVDVEYDKIKKPRPAGELREKIVRAVLEHGRDVFVATLRTVHNVPPSGTVMAARGVPSAGADAAAHGIDEERIARNVEGLKASRNFLGETDAQLRERAIRMISQRTPRRAAAGL